MSRLHREIRTRIITELEATDFDAIIVLSVEGFQYFAGYWIPYARHYLTRYNIVIWPRDGEPVLLVGADQVESPRANSWITDIRTYAERDKPRPAGIVEELASIITELGLERGRVGLEFLHASVAFSRMLTQLLPRLQLMPCDGWIYGLRAVKTPGELEIMRRCAVAAELGLMDALRDAEVAMSEKQLASRIRIRGLERGVDNVGVVLLGFGKGASGFLGPTDRRLCCGDLVRIDLNANLEGYYADLGRMAVGGKSSQDQVDIYGRQLELNRQVISFMRPGVTASEVFVRARHAADRLKVSLLDQPSIGIGHATGVNANDFPHLNVGEDTVFQCGMVFNVEPDIIGPNGEAMHVEEMVVVEDSGASVMTASVDWSELVQIGKCTRTDNDEA